MINSQSTKTYEVIKTQPANKDFQVITSNPSIANQKAPINKEIFKYVSKQVDLNSSTVTTKVMPKITVVNVAKTPERKQIMNYMFDLKRYNQDPSTI